MPRPPSTETPEQIAERKRGYCRKWRKNNPHYSREWRKNNLERSRRYSREWMAEWRKNNPKEMKRRNRESQLRRYGLTQKDVDRMLAKQKFKCAICDSTLKDWHVDHCHRTKKVRGILCAACNKGLGHFVDSPQLLQNAARYLLK